MIILVMNFFLYSSLMYYCHLFLVSSAAVRTIPLLSFIVPIFAWNILFGISNFLAEISSLSQSMFSSFFFCMVWLRKLYISFLFFGTLHSDGCIFAFLLCLLLLFFSQLFVSSPQTTSSLFCISFSWGWFSSLPPVQCYEPPSIALQRVVYQI